MSHRQRRWSYRMARPHWGPILGVHPMSDLFDPIHFPSTGQVALAVDPRTSDGFISIDLKALNFRSTNLVRDLMSRLSLTAQVLRAVVHSTLRPMLWQTSRRRRSRRPCRCGSVRFLGKPCCQRRMVGRLRPANQPLICFDRSILAAQPFSGGWTAGANQLSQLAVDSDADGRVRQVILLTDGHGTEKPTPSSCMPMPTVPFNRVFKPVALALVTITCHCRSRPWPMEGAGRLHHATDKHELVQPLLEEVQSAGQ